MMRTRYLLALAKLQAEQRRMLGVFATTADLDLVVVEDTGQALIWLERHDASVILLDATMPKAERLCHKARGKRSLSGVPILALSQELSDVFTEKLYGLGVDDVIPTSAWPTLIARLRSLPGQDAPIPTPKLGRAVVADADRARCDVIGHVLANAGFELRFAGDERVLEYYAHQEDVRLVVASAELMPPRALVERARATGSQSAFIIMSSKRELEGHSEALTEFPNVATISQNSPPDDLLFLANELTSGKSGSGRTSERVLYGTTVGFRRVGADSDDYGFTYNISAQGMYIRTLASPDEGSVWLELRPPRAKDRVRLEGTVIWKCPFGRAVGAAAPPGFAVRLNEGLGTGLRAWVESYEAWAQNAKRRGGSLLSSEPPRPESSQPTIEVALSSEPPQIERAPSGPLSAPSPATEARDATRTERKSRSDLERQLPTVIIAAEQSPDAPVAAPPAPEPPARDQPTTPPSSLMERRNNEPESEPPATSPAKQRRRALYVLATLAWLVIGGALFFSTRTRQPKGPIPTGSSSAQPSATPAEATARAVPDGASDSGLDAGSNDAAPANDAALAPASELEPTQGRLLVSSSMPAFVFLNGVRAGSTNQPLTVRCGTRYMRLGREQAGEWLSDGQSVRIACRTETRVTLEAHQNYSEARPR